MFDVAPTELLLIAVVAVLVIGPKDLPRALYKLGQVMAKVRGMTRHFRTGLDAMVREAELEELQKQWAKQNQRIMEESRQPAIDDGLPPVEAGSGVAKAPEGSGGPLLDPESTPHPEKVVAAEKPPSAPANPVPAENARFSDDGKEQASLPLDQPKGPHPA